MKFLTGDQKKFYQENGFILLSNIFSEEEFEVISDEYSNVFKVTLFAVVVVVEKGSHFEEKRSPVSQ